MSCSPHIRHSMLNFFFDGVPPPHEETLTGEPETTGDTEDTQQPGRSAEPSDLSDTFFIHQPYKTDHCTSCHEKNNIGNLIAGKGTLCIYCHDPYTGIHKKTHGPVQAGMCMVCHDPHFSSYQYMLKTDTEELCTQCHNKHQLSDESHKAELSNDCTACHDPHAGPLNLLKSNTDL